MLNKNTDRQSHSQILVVLLLVTFFFFLYVIRDYIVPLLLAFIFTGLLNPMYNYFQTKFKMSKTISSIIVTLIFFLLIIVPTLFLIIEILNQASSLTNTVIPLLESQFGEGADNTDKQLPSWFPYADELQPYRETIYDRITEFIGKLGSIFVNALTSLTSSSFNFFINLFIMLYALQFFLTHQEAVLQRFRQYLPLTSSEFDRVLEKVISVSRATVKGAFLIGLIQGALTAMGLYIFGFPGAIFLGSIAALMSLVPSVGCAIVYVPVGIFMIMSGDVANGIGELLWGFIVVGLSDNILRPYLVGKDVEMSELLVLISTLGGLGMFGISGIIIGPLLAGLLMTLGQIYRDSIND